MHKQFLLNPDGSIPEGVDVALLESLGIPLVLPTPIPNEPGLTAIEQEPVQDAEGVWHQVWLMVPSADIAETPE